MNPEQWLSLKWNGGSTMSDRWLNQSKIIQQSWKTYQDTLMINSVALKRGLDEQGYKLFWLYRVYREPSAKARERYKKIIRDTDKTYLVWMDGEEYQYKELTWTTNDTKDRDENLEKQYVNICVEYK